MASVVLKLITNPRPETRLGGWWEGEVGRGAGGRGEAGRGGRGGEVGRGLGGGGGGRQSGSSRNALHLFSFVPSWACH
jgi:hypothetical protein